jgi:hypothetical protein|tara:strand:- start:74 stop:466 length:393 start_codon:yes stop_codon:yes gene_type:complete
MADILKTVSNPLGTLIFKETAANATLIANVFAKTAPTLISVKLDNSANGTEAVYLKLYENTVADGQGITVGTTVPVFIMKVAAASTVEMYIPQGLSFSSSNYAHMAVTTEKGIAGTTAPTGTVQVTLIGS